MNNLANIDPAQQNTPPGSQRGEIVYGIRAKAEKIVLLSLNLQTGQVKDLSDRTAGLTLRPKERLTDLLSPATNTFEITTTAPILDGKEHSNRLNMIERETVSDRPITDLGPNSTIEGVVPIKGNQRLWLVSLNRGTPPFVLAISERRTTRLTVIPGFDRPPNLRLGNLTHSPKGEIYVTTLSAEGDTRLEQIDLAQQKLIRLPLLRWNGKPLLNDLKSMAMSPSGKLYALGDPQYQERNSLFDVDMKTGAMSLVRAFEVEKIAFAPT